MGILFVGRPFDKRTHTQPHCRYVEESNADILLEPQIKTTRTFMNLGGGSVTITGYPASFKDFRKASEADLDALQKADPRLYNLSKKKK